MQLESIPPRPTPAERSPVAARETLSKILLATALCATLAVVSPAVAWEIDTGG